MGKPPLFLDVEVRDLPAVRTLHCCLYFGSQPDRPDSTIRPTFRGLREQVSAFGLDPGTLLHVGIPEVMDGQLVSYDCCIEFPLPEAQGVRVLPGGRYAVLTVEKTPARIAAAIRAFRGDYLEQSGLILDEDRPTYEVYFEDSMEYCLPVR